MPGVKPRKRRRGSDSSPRGGETAAEADPKGFDRNDFGKGLQSAVSSSGSGPRSGPALGPAGAGDGAGGDDDEETTLWGMYEFLAMFARAYVGHQLSFDDVRIAALEAITKAAVAAVRSGREDVRLDDSTGPHLQRWLKLVIFDKQGEIKDTAQFFEWVLRCMAVRRRKIQTPGSMGSATEQAPPEEEEEQRGQENVALNRGEVSSCYRELAETFLRNELRPEQQRDHKLRWQDGQTGLTGPQRSSFDAALRRNLGDKKVATFIFQHGAPRTLLTPAHLLEGHAPATEQRVQRRVRHLPDALAEALVWLTALAHSFRDRAAHPDLAENRALSARPRDRDPADEIRLQQRRAQLQDATTDIRRGRRLAKERDSYKRTFADMTPEEQELLEAYETDKLHKRRRQHTHVPLPVFRGTDPGAAACSSGAAPFFGDNLYQ